jgi:L-ascorbate metabolism protein UlaG (beta-lactamase superfamily)
MKHYLFSFFLMVFCSGTIFSQKDLQVTYLANEGFLLRTASHKVLIDAIFNDGYGAFAVPPKEALQQIMEMKAPFDSIDMYMLTHYHKDHCDAAMVQTYIQKHPSIPLVANKPAFVFIDGVCFGFVQLKKQFREMTPAINESVSETIKGIPVKAFGLKHLSYIKNEIDLEEYMMNTAYLFEMDGIKIFHSGDIKMNALQDYLATHKKWNDKIDIAFLYYELLNQGDADLEFILKTLHPTQIVLMHIPPKMNELWKSNIERMKTKFPDIHFFAEPMTTQTFHF